MRTTSAHHMLRERRPQDGESRDCTMGKRCCTRLSLVPAPALYVAEYLIRRRGGQYWRRDHICRDCARRFAANHDLPLPAPY